MLLILFSGLSGKAEAPVIPTQERGRRSPHTLHTTHLWGWIKEDRGETHPVRAENGQNGITLLSQEGKRSLCRMRILQIRFFICQDESGCDISFLQERTHQSVEKTPPEGGRQNKQPRKKPLVLYACLPVYSSHNDPVCFIEYGEQAVTSSWVWGD